MTEGELREAIAGLGPWHHDVEVTPGLRTGDVPLAGDRSDARAPTSYRPEVQIQRLGADLFDGDFESRSFLDCACNGGGHALAAARLGAGQCFGFDAREAWVKQAQFLARFAPHENMKFETMQLDELPARKPGMFDVTLFSGIFYHLPDPVRGLKIAADHTRQLIVVNTAARRARGNALRVNRESAEEAMSGVDGLAWLPSGPGVLKDILNWCGFPATRLDWMNITSRGWSRIQIIAARDESAFRTYDRNRPDVAGPIHHRALGHAYRFARRFLPR
jgi:SAM-dependent methyltransferase